MNERLQILKLLEEGKINAEEAERLLEAVARSEGHDKGSRHKIWASLEGLPKVISAALGDSFSEAAETEFYKYPNKRKVMFKGISGDLEIGGTDTDTIAIQKEGYAKIKDRDDSIAIQALSANVIMTVPKKIDLIIAGISGDINVSGIDGNLEIESVSGDITGKQLSGSLSVEIVSGDIDLDYENVEKIKIRSKSGDVILRLDEKVETEILIQTEDGTATCDFDLINKREEGDILSGIINKGGARIEITNKHGGVQIKKRH